MFSFIIASNSSYMFSKLSIPFVIFLIFCLSCKESSVSTTTSTTKSIQEAPETNHPSFVSDMEVAHQKTKLLSNGIVCFNLDMTFGSRKSQMKIFTTPSSSAIRVDKKDGPSTVMVDGNIYSDADSSKWRSEQFGIYTYQYFFMAPYKFSDQGTVWKKLPKMKIEDRMLNRAQLTFETGTGDSPNDWYMVHSNPETNRVEYIGYIVTGGGTSIEEAEKNAHAIKYSDYQMVGGIPFAKKWEFFDYNKTTGLGDKIGEGEIKNIEFMDVVDQFEIIHDGTYHKINS